MLERGFYGLCGLPTFFCRIMTIHFAGMIAKKQAITYNDGVILQTKTKGEMWKNLESCFKCLRSSGLKAAPNKTKLFLRKVQFLGHIVSNKGIQPVAKKVQDLKNLKIPEHKRDVMRILGSLSFYSIFIKNLHMDSKPYYELLKDDVPFEWTKEHAKLFQNIKDRISEETILAVPNPKYPFHIHVDSSSIGTGSILVQEFPSGKCIVSFNSRVFTKDELKCQLCIVNYVESYPLYKLMSISSLVHHIRSKNFVITSHCCTCGHEKEDYLTVSSDTKWSLPSSLIFKSFGLLEKT